MLQLQIDNVAMILLASGVSTVPRAEGARNLSSKQVQEDEKCCLS